MKRFIATIKRWLSGLSFKTGIIILVVCILLYILSFAQMLLPISNSAKVTLWVILFGLAKATQYTGLAIVGVEGWRRIKSRLKRNREDKK
jgi:phosphoglycolate phosphatase